MQLNSAAVGMVYIGGNNSAVLRNSLRNITMLTTVLVWPQGWMLFGLHFGFWALVKGMK